jgi:hypothetical protein
LIAIDHNGRQCGSRCHEAKDTVCECICNGALHGAEYREGGVMVAINQAQVSNLQLNFLDVLNRVDGEGDACSFSFLDESINEENSC